MMGPFSSFPFTQGALRACSRVSDLDVFTHTAEVKVDPDKPLLGARLAVLQVALWRKTPEPECHDTLCFVFISAL